MYSWFMCVCYVMYAYMQKKIIENELVCMYVCMILCDACVQVRINSWRIWEIKLCIHVDQGRE